MSSQLRCLAAQRRGHRRRAVEEAGGLQREARGLGGHHRPVLEPRKVRHAEAVPEHDRLARQAPAARRPLRQPRPVPRVLVGELAAGEALRATPVERAGRVPSALKAGGISMGNEILEERE